MGFADFAVGFAGGFANETVRQKDRQADEDSRIVELSLTSMAAKAKTMSEVEREQETLLRNATNLQRITGGAADTGTFFEELRLGLTPAQILENLEENPNRYVPIGTGSTATPTSAPAQTNFDIGAAAVSQFGGPTKQAAAAMDSAIANRPTAPAANLGEQDIDLLTRTIIGEAASEPEQGQAAVASVVLNRLNSGQYGGTVRDVLFARNQFQPWTDAVTRERLMKIPTDSPEYQNARRVAEAVVSGQVQDFSQGALNFANPAVVRQYADSGKATPATLSWVEDVAQNGVRIGNHVFGTPGSQPDANGVQVARNEFSPTDTQMADSGLANPTGTAPVQEPEQELSGFDRVRSGAQRLFGMDPESRQTRIQQQVAAGRSALGLDNVSNEGFAVPPSNFRINVGSGGADLSDLVGKDKEYINQWMVINGDTLTEQDRNRVSAISDRATEESDFDSPEDVNEAQVRYNMAIANGNPAEADLLATYIESTLNQNTGQVPVQVKIAPRPGMSVEEMVSEGVSTQLAVQSFVDGQIVYRNTAGEIIPQNQIIGAVEEEEKKALANVSAVLRTDIRDYQASRRGLFAFSELARDMGQLVEDNPAVTTKVAGGVSAIVSFTREGATAIDVVQGMFGEGRDSVTLSEVETELAERGIIREGESLNSLGSKENLERILGASTVDLAEAKRVFDAMAIIATFRAGGLEGQSGQAMSNKDFERLSQFLTAARGPEGFRRSVGGYLGNLVETVRQQERDLLSDGVVESFRTNYFRNPIVTSTFDQALSQRPATQSALEYFSSGNTPASPAQQAQPAVSIPAGAIDMLNQNADNPAILRAFEEKYGVSATQYINRGR